MNNLTHEEQSCILIGLASLSSSRDDWATFAKQLHEKLSNRWAGGTEMSEIPFHEADLRKPKSGWLTNGIIYDLTGNRRVEVWKQKEDDGYCVRIFCPTVDGKTSKLLFGLSSDAAAALASGLVEHLSRAKPL